MIKNKKIILAAFACATLLLGGAPSANAQTPECVFLKDLEMGAFGDDVKCLQKYLNSTEFKVSITGVGSPGNETNIFRDGTKEAVKKWQKAHGLSSSGFFGPLSRAKYYELLIPAIPTPTPEPVVTPVPAPQPSTSIISSAASNMISRFKVAKDLIKKVKGEINDAEDSDSEIGDSEQMLEDAEEVFFEALYAFIDNNTDDATGLVNDAISIASQARKEIDGDDDDRGLTQANAIVFTNETVVKVRYKGEDFVFTSTEERKKDLIEEIMDEVDDNDLTEEEIDDVLNIETEDRESARSDKKFNEQDEARDALDDADEAFDEAKDKIDEADKDGEDTSDAEDIMDDADNKLDDAQDAYDEKNYDEAIDLIEEARDLIKDALDEIK